MEEINSSILQSDSFKTHNLDDSPIRLDSKSKKNDEKKIRSTHSTNGKNFENAKEIEIEELSDEEKEIQKHNKKNNETIELNSDTEHEIDKITMEAKRVLTLSSKKIGDQLVLTGLSPDYENVKQKVMRNLEQNPIRKIQMLKDEDVPNQ